MNKFNWETSGALKDFSNHITAGGSYREFLRILKDKYGKAVSIGRLSQIKKQYLIDHIALEHNNAEGEKHIGL